FVGVGGAGMSGYARAAHALGATVSGSDKARTPYLERLSQEGVLEARIGHDGANVPAGADVELVHSSAVSPQNPERVAARERGLPDRPRAELLAELTALRRTIAVAGAHGKTTTSSMIVHVLREAGLDPSWLVGSSVGGGLANSHWAPPGRGDWLVVEADESDRSMLSLDVEIAVLTNVELDHHATFASLEELREAFREFLAHARRAIVAWDRPDLLALLPPAASGAQQERSLAHGGPATSGAEEGGSGLKVVRYDVPAPELRPGGSSFLWRGERVQLSVPGAHNALNAAAALEVARLIGVDKEDACGAIAGFGGAARRFQRLGTSPRGAVVIDDYAHHPTEVAATLSAARTLQPRRLVAVFQPHLYSRTALLAEEFGLALAQADVVAVLDVYPARERAEDHPGVSGHTIARSIADRTDAVELLYPSSFEDAQRALGDLLQDGDLCVVMGAGDVDTLARRLLKRGPEESIEGPA
ncbi:MAG TPA: UDP-N-acetylmuramate--L-alanine ligase, partial [Solirubrobacteraceae bacterium]|nr:UDP-N-acetylmuramate--L-alanine ligase [Solirubrobacteraceae bacterium]